MLPSFRLIVAAFLCGFIVVFAGLRLAATLHHVHASMPVMAAHAAPLAPSAQAAPAVPRAAAPILYDLRFVGSGTALAPAPVSLTPGAADPVVPGPPRVVPPDEIAAPPPVAAIDPDVVTRHPR